MGASKTSVRSKEGQETDSPKEGFRTGSMVQKALVRSMDILHDKKSSNVDKSFDSMDANANAPIKKPKSKRGLLAKETNGDAILKSHELLKSPGIVSPFLYHLHIMS
jgi:hypothetical protein